MKDLNSIEKNFIKGVWRKVQYLEYKRMEKEQLSANQRNLFRRKLILAAAILSVLVPVSFLLLYECEPDTFAIMMAGSLFIGAGQLYDTCPDFCPKNIIKRRHIL